MTPRPLSPFLPHGLFCQYLRLLFSLFLLTEYRGEEKVNTYAFLFIAGEKTTKLLSVAQGEGATMVHMEGAEPRRMDMKGTVIVLTVILLLRPCFAQERLHPAGDKQRVMVTLPQGLEMEIALENTLDSRTTRVGDPIRARLVQPLVAGERVVVPEGTMLSGKVTEVTGPQMAVMKAKMKFIFTSMKTRSGTVPIEASAHLDLSAMAMKGGKAAGTMVAKDVAKRAIPVLGTVYLIQDVANAAKFVTEEKEITIPTGTRMKVMLDKDVQFPVGHAAR